MGCFRLFRAFPSFVSIPEFADFLFCFVGTEL